MEKIVNKLFGEELTQYLLTLLDVFQKEKYTEKEIYSSIKMMNESVRTYLIGLAYDKKMDAYVEILQGLNQKLKRERVEEFKKAYQKNETEKYLVMLSKIDKLSLLEDMHLTKSSTHLSLEEKKIISLIEKSIKESQSYDKRDGIKDFLAYDKTS